MNKSLLSLIILLFLFTCYSPYSDKLFPMEQFLQGGWYRIGSRAIGDTGGVNFDINTTFEILFFKNHELKQYENNGNHVALYLWSFLADSIELYRKTDSISITSPLLINDDTLLIQKGIQYNLFFRYNSSSLPSSWPDSIVESSYKP
jgi:hypothetical protein